MPFSVLGKASLYFSRFALRSHCTPFNRYERGAVARIRFLCSFPSPSVAGDSVSRPSMTPIADGAIACVVSRRVYSIAEARQHIGKDQCVSGKLVRVKHGGRGVTLFDFCQDSMVCPFTVVVFAHDLKRIGDVSQLQNKGDRSPWPGERVRQTGRDCPRPTAATRGEGLGIARLPKNYDVENKGHNSAGSFSLPKPAYTTHKKTNGKDSDRCPARLRFD